MKRKLILTFLACGASVALATAQTPAASPSASPAASPGTWAGHGHGGGVLAHLSSALDLSGSQQAAVAPILEAAKPQLKAIRDNAEAQRKALISSVSAQITPLLTPDQQTKFAALVQKVEAGGYRHSRRPGGPNAGVAVLDRLTTKLGLTTAQQAQIKPILEAAHTQVLAVRQDTMLTPDEKFAKFKGTMEAVHNQIEGILTPAQQAQLASMKGKFFHSHGVPEAEPSASPVPSGT